MKKFKSTRTIKMNRDDSDYEPDLFLGYHEKQIVISEVTIPLDEEIKAPKYYRHVLARISDLEEGDNLVFELRTPGGDLRGITALIHAVKGTEANVHCHIDTEADSAGSLFALNCPSISVAPWAMMMIHTGQGVSAGTMLNKAAYSTFMETELNKMMREAYTGFLTDEELEQVFLGKEFWFNAEQIIERLKNKQAYLQENSHDSDYDQDLQYEDCNGACDDCACHAEELHYGQPLPEGIKKPTRMQMPKDWDKD